MSAQRASLFLERQSYRRRRLIDMLRMLPVIGMLLWSIPLLWSSGDTVGDRVATSDAIIFIFLVWLSMVSGAGVLARVMKHSDTDEDKKADAWAR